MSYARPRAAGRLVRGVLAGLCAGLLGVSLGAGPAAAEDPVPGGFGSWEELLAMQEQLNGAAEQISAAGADQSGFTGIVASPQDRRLRLYWHGVPPDPVLELVGELRREVPIDLLPAPYPLSELREQQELIAPEPGVSAVFPHIDGSGLTVEFAGSEADARAVPAIAGATVPVTIVPDATVEPTDCSGRQDDCSPYSGGGRYVTGSLCTTGFTLRYQLLTIPPTAPSYRILSAGHCGSNGATVKDGGGQMIGSVVNDLDSADLLQIAPSRTVGLGPTVFTGPVGSTSTKVVKKAADSFVGNWVCPSGASTGEHCEVIVDAVNVTILGTVKTIRASHYYLDQAAVGKGDSGGPVIVHQWWGGGVYALGTISAGSSQVACPPGSVSAVCYHTIYYVGILHALALYGWTFGSVNVLTG